LRLPPLFEGQLDYDLDVIREHLPCLTENLSGCVHLNAVGGSGQDRSQSHQDNAEHKTFFAAPHIDELGFYCQPIAIHPITM
jgi:hypothetical protein